MELVVRAQKGRLGWGTGEVTPLPSSSSPLSLLLLLLVFPPEVPLRSQGWLQGASVEQVEELSEQPQSSCCPRSSRPCHPLGGLLS